MTMRVEPHHQTLWDWRAAVQFSCGGAGTGLLFFTAVAALSDPAWLLRAGVPAMILIAIGLFSVWIKLGRRWRAALVVLNPRTSWMSREALLSLPLGLFGLGAILFANPYLALVAALSGLAFLYAQAQILRAARGIPAWRERLILPLIVITGLSEGAGLLLALTVFLATAVTWLPLVAFLLVAGRLWAWQAYRAKLSRPAGAPLATVAAIEQAHPSLLFAGHILPLLALPLAFLVPPLALVAHLVAAAAVVFGGWYLKFTLITRAAYTQGYAIAHAPARTPGYSGPGARPGWS
jgi:phenylacetyl-CoA:acceptor oxidoreductase 26-kDa subunit